MATITLTKSADCFSATVTVPENEVNDYVQMAQRNGLGITVEVESEAYQQYLRDFPLNDPRD